jgi:segregation and condensation protein B
MSHDPTGEPPQDAAPDTLPPSSENPAGDDQAHATTPEPVEEAPFEPSVPWDDVPTVNLTGEELAAAVNGLPEATEDSDVEQARELSRSHLQGLLEALIFASDKPMKDREVARLASAPVKLVRELLAELKAVYATRGIVLDEVAGGWLFRTSVQYAPFVREMSAEKPVRLTRAQVETLAIAAYRQPITRPEIDDIRGVDSGATLKLLLERDLLRIMGKKDEPGRPLLYGTTTQFLEFFGLKSLKDLPTLKEFTELSDESRRVAEAELGDVLPEVSGAADLKAALEAVPARVDDTIAPPDTTEHDTVAPPAPETQDKLETTAEADELDEGEDAGEGEGDPEPPDDDDHDDDTKES